MPQPDSVRAAADALIATYRDAHASLLARYEAIVTDPSRARQASRLRELIAATDATLDGLYEATRSYWATTLPAIHAAGAAQAAALLGSDFQWTMAHRSAVEQLAARTWETIAPNLRGIRAETRAALRSGVADATREVLLEGRTATQAGRDLARTAARDGLWSVEYSNGARHTIADYADTVIRTTTAEAYNGGSLTQTITDGITHVEYLDGAGCGVTSHDDPTEANGLIVPVEDVVLLSHPRCRRALAPAPNARELSGIVDRDIGPPRPAGPAVISAVRQPRTARTERQPRQARTAAAS